MAEWHDVYVSPKRFTEERRASRSEPSLHDMPVAVRVNVDRESGALAFELKYLSGEERAFRWEHSSGIALIIGKRSSRIQRIEVDLNRIEALDESGAVDLPAVVVALKVAGRDLSRDLKRHRRSAPYRRRNIEIAEGTLQEYAGGLLTHAGA